MGGEIPLEFIIPGKSINKAKTCHSIVRLSRIQLEIDSGKSVHDVEPGLTLVDLNRAGVGLMEIVSEPDMRSATEAGVFLKKLQVLL